MSHTKPANKAFSEVVYSEKRAHAFSARFGDTLYNAIQARAEAANRSQSDVVNEAVAAYLLAPNCENCQHKAHVPAPAPRVDEAARGFSALLARIFHSRAWCVA